ncbi:MAG: hypothetical protein JWO38_910 [Gemmataceae bacterium]|nr:hypothetical protein [Gemmataceae bacterium]
MNLSRAAKKLRALGPNEPVPPKPVVAKKPAKAPEPEPVTEPIVEAVEPVQEPAAPPEPLPVKAKRPRFVRAKTEKRERVTLPPLPPPSNKPAARLMTKNLSLPPKDDAPKLGR